MVGKDTGSHAAHDAATQSGETPPADDAPPGETAGLFGDADVERFTPRDPGDTDPAPFAGDCPVTPLGRRGRVFYYLSPAGEFWRLRDREHPAANLDGLLDGDLEWATHYFPRLDAQGRRRVGKYDANSLRPALMGLCARQGFFVPDRALRGVGAWRDEAGRLILHCGDALWRDGKMTPAGTVLEGQVYAAQPAEPRPETRDPLGDADAGRLLELLDCWAWRNQAAPRLVLGFIAGALICGALDWRSHLWVTGAPNSGKSELERLVARLVGSWALRFAGDTREAAIRQMLAGGARPVLFDEIEPDVRGERIKHILRLARLASAEGQAGIGRGSLSGEATVYPVRAMIYFSSVLVSGLQSADLGRVVRLDLEPGRHARSRGVQGTPHRVGAGHRPADARPPGVGLVRIPSQP